MKGKYKIVHRSFTGHLTLTRAPLGERLHVCEHFDMAESGFLPPYEVTCAVRRERALETLHARRTDAPAVFLKNNNNIVDNYLDTPGPTS